MKKITSPFLVVFLVCVFVAGCQKRFWHTKSATDLKGNTIEVTSLYTNGESQKLEILFQEANSKLQESSVIETDFKFSDFEFNHFGMLSCNIILFDKDGNRIESIKWIRKNSGEGWHRRSVRKGTSTTPLP